MNPGAKRSIIPLSRYPLNEWPVPDVNVLPRPEREKFERRQLAVLMYADGTPYQEIRTSSGINPQETRRLVRRCVKTVADGSIVGFYALIPGWRIKQYNRTAKVQHTIGGGPGGCSGALMQLFCRFPHVRDYVRARFLRLSGTGKLKATRISFTDLHGEFLDELRKLHLGENDWPFNTSPLVLVRERALVRSATSINLMELHICPHKMPKIANIGISHKSPNSTRSTPRWQ